MKTIERHDRTALWFHPIDAVRRAVVGHREYPHGIGAKHHAGVEPFHRHSYHRAPGDSASRFSIACHSAAKA